MSIHHTISRIEAFAAAKKWSKRRLAEEAELSDTTLRDLGKPDWNPTRETLEKLERVIPAEFQPANDTMGPSDRAVGQ